MVKVPLVCSITKEKMNIPARGIFCTHYSCFDVNNFLEIVCSSSNPRWVCPVCKKPCYEFKIDIILFTILELYQERKELEQVIFLKRGEFKVF